MQAEIGRQHTFFSIEVVVGLRTTHRVFGQTLDLDQAEGRQKLSPSNPTLDHPPTILITRFGLQAHTTKPGGRQHDYLKQPPFRF